MKVKELTLTAVIPTAQYANLQPSITVEVEDGDFDGAKKVAMDEIIKFSKQYAEGDKALSDGQPTTIKARLLEPFIGEGDIYFDEASHTYYDKDGNIFQSGSQFAKQFEHPFNVDAIVPAYAKKFGVDEQAVKDFWKSKADASTTFGTALHQALETYGKYYGMAAQLTTHDKEVLIGVHPTLLPIVEEFFNDKRMSEDAVYEPFVEDYEGKRCGQIDRLVFVDRAKKIVDIEDYKTNADLYKQNSPKFLKEPYKDLPNQPISGYAIQLSFYAAILEANGYTIRDLKLHHWTGKEWITIKLDRVKI